MSEAAKRDAAAEESAPQPVDAFYVGESAVRELTDMSVPPYPPYYEVWFAHLGQMNEDLSREIARARDGGRAIDENFMKMIHGRYFASNHQSEDIENFAAELLKETGEVKVLSQRFDSSAREFREDLSAAAEEAEADDNPERSARALLATLVETAKSAIARNADLEDKLSASSKKIANLQEAIESIAVDANTDFLTKLRNRRFFDETIKRLIEEAEENGAPLTLIVCDIDHFKKFNDSWGHQIGDQALKLVASVLRDNVKGQDLLARYGGEEFTIALPNTAIEDATTLAEKIRIAVSKRRLIHRFTKTDLGHITMSFGVALHQPGASTDALFRASDEALYSAKSAGRNRVACAPTRS